MNEKKLQGIFHLLSILFIPAILVSALLLENVWLTVVLAGLLIVILVVLFSKRKAS